MSSASDVSVVKELATGQDTAEARQTQQDCSLTTRTPLMDSHTKILQTTDPSSEITEDVTVCNDLAQVHICSEQYEFQKSSSTQVNVKGNLKKHLRFWKDVGAPQFILNVIESGYKLPFTSIPASVNIRNNRSARLHAQFVEDAINELCQSGRVVECQERPGVVNPLSVSVQASGKKRLILDLRYVNKFLFKQSVKYEDWKIAMSYFSPDSYMFTFDLKSGYHHIEIYPEHQTYLGFAWEFGNSNITKYYKFTVLPFGLSTAPYIFTKMLKPLQKHWRYQGICLALFLDDGWGNGRDIATCKSDSDIVKADLANAGLIANQEKSVWEPTQTCSWLGLIWHSKEGRIEISERRIELQKRSRILLPLSL